MSLYDDASLILYPSGYKEDKIYSLKPTDGSGDLTFTRASTATRVNADGLIETSPVNIVTYSNDFSNADWTKVDATETSGQTGYDGSSNAWLLTKSAANGRIQELLTSIGVNTYSLYAKANTLNYMRLRVEGTINVSCFFDFINGTIHNNDGIDATMTNLGGGWYRCSYSFSTSVDRISIYPADGNNDVSGTSGSIYIQDAQLNIGATAKPYFPTTDRLNVPRIDYTGGGCGKLLLESQRTNLALYSEQFDNAYWTKLGATITANATTSPDGTQNADKLVEGLGFVQPSFYRTNIANSNTTYTKSIYAKSGERIWLVTNIGNGINSARAWFNLSTGVVGTVNAGLTAQIQDAGNGWYRCTITREVVAFASSVIEFQIATSDGVEGYTGNGTSGLFIYGCQFEAGSYVSSYIPTLASSVTRLADTCSKTGISDKIGASEGVLFTDFVYNGFQDYGTPLCVNDGTTNNYIWLTTFGNGTLRGEVYGSGTVQATFSMSGAVVGQRYKMALAYKANDFAMYVNGVQIGTDLNGTIPSNLSRVDYDIANPSLFSLSLLQINQSAIFIIVSKPHHMLLF